MPADLSDIVRVLVPAFMAFVVGMALTPFITHYLYKYRAWKKTPGKLSLDGAPALQFNLLHNGHETRAPRMGGIVVWASVIITIIGIALLARLVPEAAALKFDFLSREQTWIPLATLIIGAFVGLIDDLFAIQPGGMGIKLSYRLLIVVALSSFIGMWFWLKLEVTAIGIPFGMPLEIGWLIVPLFIFVSLALYASGVIDGIDGLSGGVFGSVFASYAIIAFAQNQLDLAAFSAAIVGGLATVASNVLQVVSKRYFGKELFRIAPLHHHFEAIGWPGYKVVMRYWVLSVVFAFVGVIIALAGS